MRHLRRHQRVLLTRYPRPHPLPRRLATLFAAHTQNPTKTSDEDWVGLIGGDDNERAAAIKREFVFELAL